MAKANKMQDKQLEQIKSYCTLMVQELHQAIFEGNIFDKVKTTLSLAEELECYMMQIERERTLRSNIIQFRRIA